MRSASGCQGTDQNDCGRLRGGERRRFLDLGILPGTLVEAAFSSPSGNPTAYRVRGALIALRREQANHIHIESVQEVVDAAR